MMKQIKVFAGILVLLLLFAGFAKPAVYTETEFLMDTVVSVTAYGTHAKEAISAVFMRLRELDKKCNAHQKGSVIYAINTAPKNVPISVDEEMFDLIQQSLLFSNDAQGAFDITLFPVSTLWAFGTKEATVPQETAIVTALTTTGADKLMLDKENRTITKTNSGTQLDLGAAVKGYAAEEALKILKENGISHAYLDLGGNVAVMGGKPTRFLKRLLTGKKAEPFIIGLQMPDAPRGTVMETLSLYDGFIVTSGNYERYFEENGKRYHHILNPKTGYPVYNGLKSVTVVADNGLEADMLSTALFVLGEENMPLLANRCQGIYVIDDQMELTAVKPLITAEN